MGPIRPIGRCSFLQRGPAMKQERDCPDCRDGVDRRGFLRTVGVTAAAAAAAPLLGTKAVASPTPKSPAETAVKGLYESLTDDQRDKICFTWDHEAKGRGLLRTFVSNNWQITPQPVVNKMGPQFYTKKQQDLIHDIFKGLINPDWYTKFMKQLKDDNGGDPWG